MFIAALFTKATMRNKPRFLKTDEWIKKMWHIYTMEYYSAIKENETIFFCRKIYRTEDHHVE
jgi:hypothetical protein